MDLPLIGPTGLVQTRQLQLRGIGAFARAERGSFALLVVFVVVAVYLGRLHQLMPFTSWIPVGKILLPLGWLALLMQPGTAKRFAVLGTSQARMFGLLVLAMAISVPFSLYASGSAEDFILFIRGPVLLVLLVAVACADERGLYGLGRTVVVTSLLLGIAMLAGRATVIEGRASMGRTYDPNDIALLGVVILPLAFWLMRGRSSLWRWIGVAGGAGSLAVVMRSASRGGMLGLGAVLFLIAVVYRKRIPMTWKIVGTVLVVVALGLAPPTFWERFGTLQNLNEDYNTYAPTGRKNLWIRGVKYFASRPLTGVGLAQFGAAEGQWASQQQDRRGAGIRWGAAHSIWIQVLAELGIFGFIGFLGLYLPTLRDVLRLRAAGGPRAPPHDELQSFGEALAIAIVGFFVSGTFLSMAYSPPAMCVAALGMSYSFVSRRRIAEGATPPAANPSPARRRGTAPSGWRRGV
jgi:O-antigen ligase